MSYLRDAKTVSSVADAYRSMYAKPNEDILNEELIDSLIEDVRDDEINEWLEYLDEDSMMSVPKQNMQKVKVAITKLSKRHPKVKVSFGTHSKGKFVDDNNINFKGNDKDIDNLMKDIQKDKPLMKMMESSELEEGALADKAKKSGISVGTLRKVYNRGMAAWKTGHRPGTTPQQWGMARVNAFIVKKKKGGLNHDKDLAHVIHPDDDMMNEVKKQEVDAMKKVSKDMQKVLVSYQKIANMGDKELKNTVHNKDYEKVLDARNTILKMIGTLNTKMLMQKENFDIVEASAGAMIDKLFNTGGDKMFQYGVAKLLNMTGVKVAMSMQKQNPVGFKNTMVAMGKDNKIKLATNNALMKMFKQQGVKPIPEALDDKDVPKVKEIIKKLKGASKAHAGQAKDLEKAVSEGKNFAQQAAIAIAKKKKAGKPGFDKEGKRLKAHHDMDEAAKYTNVFNAIKGIRNLKRKEAEFIANLDPAIMYQVSKKLAPMFKASGFKEELDERVKDGKLDPLSKMGKSKLTGSEIQQYYRDNPKQKAAARDKSVKKAIELALDLSGATNYAIKEIEKFKRGLSKHPAVKLALRHANESRSFTGHHVVIEALSPANVIKLKTFGKMMAKMTKLPFDENNPEKSIDKLMGQIWKQKHVPANWERLHKMVAMLRDIGVKMPSLKGKYMGLDPVTKKAIFYKEGTDEIVEWHEQIDENKDVRKKYRGKEQKSVDKLIMQKGIDKVQKHHDKNPREFDKMVKNLAMMEDVQEGIEELVEKQEMKDADIKKIAQMTDRNDHTGSLMHLAKLLGDRKGLDALKGIMMTHKALGHMPDGLMRTRNQIHDNLMRQSSSKYSNHKDVIRQF